MLQLTLLVSGVVLARALGPENRGYMALLTLVTAIAWQLGGLGIPFALTYATARAPAASARILASVRGAIATQVVLAVVASGVVLGLLTAGEPEYVQLGALMTVVAVAPAVYQRCGLSVLQGLRQFGAFNRWRIAPNAFFAVVATGFLVADVTAFTAYAAAWAGSRSIFVLPTQRAARRAANLAETGEGEPPPRTEILRFGRKAMFGGAPPVETYRVDQSVVALFLAPTALGYYVAALAFTNLPRFIAQSFGLVSSPAIARQPTHEAARRSMWRFFWISMPFYLGVIIPLWIAAPDLARFFFGPEFEQAGAISRILLVATALFCARRVLTEAARGAGYPGIGSIAEIAAFASVLPLFAAFVPTWGVDGVAYALVGSSALALTIIVTGLLRAGSRGKVPPAWREIREGAIQEDSAAVGDLAADDAPSTEEYDTTPIRVKTWPAAPLPHPAAPARVAYRLVNDNILVPQWDEGLQPPSARYSEEIYLELAALDIDGPRAIESFVAEFGTMEATLVTSEPPYWWVAGHQEALEPYVEEVFAATKRAGVKLGEGETLAEFRWAALCIRDLVAARRVVAGELDPLDHFWESPVWDCAPQDGTQALPWEDGGALSLLHMGMADGLKRFSPTVMQGWETHPFTDVGLYELCCLQLFNHLVQDAQYRRAKAGR